LKQLLVLEAAAAAAAAAVVVVVVVASLALAMRSRELLLRRLTIDGCGPLLVVLVDVNVPIVLACFPLPIFQKLEEEVGVA
jgi:uncharacterized membrane protein